MSRRKDSPKEPGSGRKKGTPNRDNVAIRERIAKKYRGYDPILAMATIANDAKMPVEIRLSAHKEIAQYLEPKRKAVEISGEVQERVTLIISGA